MYLSLVVNKFLSPFYRRPIRKTFLTLEETPINCYLILILAMPKDQSVKPMDTKMRKIMVIAVYGLLLGLCFFAAARGAAESNPDQTATAMAPAPVRLDGKILMYVRVGALAYTPQERARDIRERIIQLALDPKVDLSSIRTVDRLDRIDIMAGETLILTLLDQDAKAAGFEKNRGVLADFYAKRIRQAAAEYREARSSRNITWGLVYVLGFSVIGFVLLIALRFFYPWLRNRIQQWQTSRISALQVKGLEVISAKRLGDFVLQLVRTTYLVLILVCLAVYAFLVLDLLPWSRGAALLLTEWAWTAAASIGTAILGYIPNLFYIAGIVILTRYAVKGLGFLFKTVEQGRLTLPGVSPDLAMITYKIVRFLMLAFAVVMAYPYLPGSQSEAFKGVSIFVGILFSLGSTSAVANAFAGLSLVYMRAFQVGDRVKIGDTMGDVLEMKMNVTRIRTIKNVEVTLSNKQVLESPIVNFSTEARTRGLILHTSVTIGYDAPWRTVHRLLTEAALRTEPILKEPAPFVLQTALNDFYVSYELNAYTDQPNRMVNTYSDLHQQIQDTFNEAGVEIMSPHYTQLRDGSRTAIPDPYLPKDYEPRALRVYPNPTPGEEGWRKAGREPEG
jgi:small-conductance mechanosensitive channel